MTDETPSKDLPDSEGDRGAPPSRPHDPTSADGPLRPDQTVMRPRDNAADPAPPPPPPGADPAGGPDHGPPATVVAPQGGAHRDPAGDLPPPDPADAVPADQAQGAHDAPGDHAGAAPFVPAPVGAGPIDPDFPTKVGRAGTTGALIALGTGLLAAAIAISGFKSREDGDLDWSNYGVGIGATAVLLFIALLATFGPRRAGGRAREEAITWPGVVAIFGTVVMIVIGIDKEENWVGYLVGGVVVAMSALGYLAARRAAFTVSALAGLALIYALLFDDLLASRVDDASSEVVTAAVIAVFVIVVTLLGWLLPSRAVTGVVAGSFGLVGLVGVMVSFLFTRYLSMFFGTMPVIGDPDGDPLAEGGFQEADVWWVLGIAGVLVVMWALAAAISNHAGFTVLAIVAPMVLVPLAMFAVAAEHPTWWSASLAGAGGALLLGGWLLSRLRTRSTQREVEAAAY